VKRKTAKLFVLLPGARTKGVSTALQDLFRELDGVLVPEEKEKLEMLANSLTTCEAMTIVVSKVDGSTIDLSVRPTDTIDTIKLRISEEDGTSTDRQIIYLSGDEQPLALTVPVASLPQQENKTVQLVLIVDGGPRLLDPKHITYTYSRQPNGDGSHYKDDSGRCLLDGRTFTGGHRIGDGCISWRKGTPVDITFEFDAEVMLKELSVGYCVNGHGWGNASPDKLELLTPTDGAAHALGQEVTAASLGIFPIDKINSGRNDCICKFTSAVACSTIIVRFKGGVSRNATGNMDKYVLDTVGFVAFGGT
jgi:hypothetical protein